MMVITVNNELIQDIEWIEINERFSVRAYIDPEKIIHGEIRDKIGFKYMHTYYDICYHFIADLFIEIKQICCDKPNKVPREIQLKIQDILDREFLPEELWG